MNGFEEEIRTYSENIFQTQGMSSENLEGNWLIPVNTERINLGVLNIMVPRNTDNVI